MADRLVLGTRRSALAQWQAHFVRDVLYSAGLQVEIALITTTGDRRLDVPLSRVGEKGLFTRELDTALLEGRIDLAVHSLKDLPSTLPEGLLLAATTQRTAPFDAFVAHPTLTGGIQSVPEGGILGTSSMRRQSQLRAWRPDLQIIPVRGNVDTRLRKLDESAWHGIILAEAGLQRLGFQDRITERVLEEIMILAVGQGALGIVCAAASKRFDLLRDLLHDPATGYATAAERAFLRRLEGGCSVPVGAHARVVGGDVALEGCVASVDGTRLFRRRMVGKASSAEVLGRDLAESLLADGADEVLNALRARAGSGS